MKTKSKHPVPITHPSLPLLQQKTHDLLNDFGSGSHKPGSGAAAALLGLLACKMMETVIKVSQRNVLLAASARNELVYIGKLVASREDPFFRDAIQRDNDQFDRYFLANQLSKQAKSDSHKKRATERARLELMRATQIPLEIARRSSELAGKGLVVFDLGASHVRGDSAVAISSAIAACNSALAVVYLNLRKFKGSQWALGIRSQADVVTFKCNELQTEQTRRVTRLQTECVPDDQMQFDFLESAPNDLFLSLN